MRSRVAKGNYYRARVREWLEREGWAVQIAEIKQGFMHPTTGGKFSVTYRTYDLWGADLIAQRDNELMVVQVKSNPKHLSDGLKEIAQWPAVTTFRRCVAVWSPGTRMATGPEWHEIEEESDGGARDPDAPA